MTSTARSRSSPANPFSAKIWRISSRSPSGWVAISRSSVRRAGPQLLVGAGAEEVAHGHAEAVPQEVRHAEDDDDPRRQPGPRGPGDDREGRHGAVDGTEDEIAQVAVARPGLEPPPDGRGGVVGLGLRWQSVSFGDHRSRSPDAE